MQFRRIWGADFEFAVAPGERPAPFCLVAKELQTGQEIRLWEDELRAHRTPPFDIGPNDLFVAFYSSAELGCFLNLGWKMPVNILDLFIEHRWLSNGKPTPCGNGLLGALVHFGLPAGAGEEKAELQQRAARGGPWAPGEREAMLDYCARDTTALSLLYPAMRSYIDWPRALLRGRSMAAVARVEWNGVPIDMPLLTKLRESWDSIRNSLISEIDRDFHVYEDGSFKRNRFAQWLVDTRTPWPRDPRSGALQLDADTFHQMAKIAPAVAPLAELRSSLSQLRLNDLAVGHDGRNRALLSPFQARTSRYQPSNTRYVFGPSTWIRGLIRPEAGMSVSYIDFEQQEFGIAAKLSNDPVMMAAYQSGDAYMAFARQAGAVPADATKESHGPTRELYKSTALAIQYGMGLESLSERLDQPISIARGLLRDHHDLYRDFWKWSDGTIDYAQLKGTLWTTFGWRVGVNPDTNSCMLRNFLMQGNGAEMLRLALIGATDRGVRVCGPIHDAMLIEAPSSDIVEAVDLTRTAMAEASRVVLDGFQLRTEVKTVHHPHRYSDPRGTRMWEIVTRLIGWEGCDVDVPGGATLAAQGVRR